jgi:hypothetical protein
MPAASGILAAASDLIAGGAIGRQRSRDQVSRLEAGWHHTDSTLTFR